MNVTDLRELLESIDPEAGGYDDYLRTRVLNEFPALARAYIEMAQALEAMLIVSQPQSSGERVFLGEAQEMAMAALNQARGEQ